MHLLLKNVILRLFFIFQVSLVFCQNLFEIFDHQTIFQNGEPGIRSGWTIGTFDTSGDGLNDIIVGNPFDLNGKGSVTLYTMKLLENGTFVIDSTAPVDDNFPGFAPVFGMLNETENFGTAVAGIFNFGRLRPVGIASGISGIYYLEFDPQTGQFSNSSFLFTLDNCSSVTDCLVESITVEDFDFDGVIDVMFGVPGRNQSRGTVFISFFNDNLTIRETIELDLTTPFGNIPLQTGDRFGQAVDCLKFGNFDVQCVIGASGSSLSGSHTGRFFRTTFGNLGLDSANSFDNGFLLRNNAEDNQFWAGSLTWFSDLDQNGSPDIFIGTREPSEQFGLYPTSPTVVLTEFPFPNIGSTRLYFNTSFPPSISPLLPGFAHAIRQLESGVLVIGNPSLNNDTGGFSLLYFDVCGTGRILERGEECDDGGRVDGDGCSANCKTEVFWQCVGEPSVCVGVCGDGFVVGNECDDGNLVSGDGCSSTCQLELGFICTTSENSTICNPQCGDSIIVSGEDCDDGNLENGDGCSSICQVESASSNNTTILAIIIIFVILPIIILCAAVILTPIGIFFYQRKNLEKKVRKALSNTKVEILRDIAVGDIIGKGEFGVVYKGDWKGIPVALKSLNGQDLESFANEMNLLLESKEHPNILNFFGVFVHQNQEFMVTELMERGDLVQFLRSDLEITTFDLYLFTSAVASGMEYLHKHKILHRDLAARNILVTGEIGNYTIKISDFGLSRKTEYYYRTDSRFIPVRWTAPEALIWAKYGFPSDVWSFGVVMYEIYSRGSIPYAGLSNQKVMDKVTRKGLRLKPPREMNRHLGNLMLSTMLEDPDERPTFTKIGSQLSKDNKYVPTERIKSSESDQNSSTPEHTYNKPSKRASKETTGAPPYQSTQQGNSTEGEESEAKEYFTAQGQKPYYPSNSTNSLKEKEGGGNSTDDSNHKEYFHHHGKTYSITSSSKSSKEDDQVVYLHKELVGLDSSVQKKISSPKQKRRSKSNLLDLSIDSNYDKSPVLNCRQPAEYKPSVLSSPRKPPVNKELSSSEEEKPSDNHYHHTPASPKSPRDLTFPELLTEYQKKETQLEKTNKKAKHLKKKNKKLRKQIKSLQQQNPQLNYNTN